MASVARYFLYALLISGFMTSAACLEQEVIVGPEVINGTAADDAAVSVTAISALLGDPEKYKGSEVTVAGKVTAGLAFEFIDEQPYIINDGSAQIWIATTGVVPKDGSEATVKGIFKSPYQIKGRRYDAAIVVRAEVRGR